MQRWMMRYILSGCLVGFVGGTASCSYSVSNHKVSLFPLRSVPVDADEGVVAALFPEVEPLSDSETLRRQSYSIQEDGGFTFTRTVERQVAVLGVATKALEVEHARERDLQPFEGVLITHAAESGAAYAAGVRKDDVLRRFQADLVRSSKQLAYLVRERSAPGAVVEVEVIRGGKPVQIDVTLSSETEIVGSQTYHRELPTFDDRNRTGITLLEVAPELQSVIFSAMARDDGEPTGLQVVEMVPGTPAFFSDMELADHVVRIGDQTVDSIADYMAALEEFEVGDQVPFELRRGRRRLETTIQIGDNARAKRGFNLLGLVSYVQKPYVSHFELVWGLLFRHHRNHTMDHGKQSETRWETVFSLLEYDGTPTRKTLTIGWFFPISVGA